jgi:hypothetical protein
MRTLGWLLVADVVYNSVLDLVRTIAVRDITSGAVTPLGWWRSVDLLGIFMALVLVALAEVFRRGAELEDEQALVV